MASQGNQHCANCIGTFSFLIEGKCPACTYPSFTLYTVQRWLNIQRTNGLRFKFVRIDSFLHSALWRIGSPSNSYPGFRAGWNSVTLVGQKQWRRQGGGGSFPPMCGRPKLCNMYVLSLSWNFFGTHDKYIARPSSQQPRWYTDNTTGTGGLRTLDPL